MFPNKFPNTVISCINNRMVLKSTEPFRFDIYDEPQSIISFIDCYSYKYIPETYVTSIDKLYYYETYKLSVYDYEDDDYERFFYPTKENNKRQKKICTNNFFRAKKIKRENYKLKRKYKNIKKQASRRMMD